MANTATTTADGGLDQLWEDTQSLKPQRGGDKPEKPRTPHVHKAKANKREKAHTAYKDTDALTTKQCVGYFFAGFFGSVAVVFCVSMFNREKPYRRQATKLALIGACAQLFLEFCMSMFLMTFMASASTNLSVVQSMLLPS